MTQALDDSRSQPAERLADAALELCLERGLGALSARALAERSGFSASAMTYHFGSRANLVQALQARVATRLTAWRAEQAAALERLGPSWMTTPAWVASTLEDLLARQRDGLALEWELEAEAELGEAGLAPGARQALVDMHAFWCWGAARTGATDEAAEAWADLAAGLATALLPEPEPARRTAWTFDALARLDARLRRADVGAAAQARPTAEARIGDPPVAEGARRILDAALRVVGEKGVDRITHRDVAAAAGVSLASTTYFFRTKSDLLYAAFDDLHRRIRAEVLESLEKGQTPPFSMPGIVDAATPIAWRVRAMEALQRAAARDPALQLRARDMLFTRGATSLSVLRGSGVADADALDAFIWSTSMSAVLRRVRAGPQNRRAGDLADIGRRRMRTLFNVD